MDELSAYEQLRLSKIRRNQAYLASLGLEKLTTRRTRTPLKLSRTKLQRRPPATPTRKSSRIAAIPAPSIYVESELSNGRLTLGGADAEKLAADKNSNRATVVASSDGGPSDEDPSPNDEDLLFPEEAEAYASLREEKNSIARELDTAAYHVAQNRALMAMVRHVPATTRELLECWGWGEAKVLAHGERLLAVLAPFAESLRKRRADRSAASTDESCTKYGAHSPPSAVLVITPTKSGIDDTGDQDNHDDTNAVRAHSPLPLKPSDLHASERPAFQALLAWKRARAKELGYSNPCVICHNRTLCELVRILPSSVASLGTVCGIGGIGTKRNDMHGCLMLAALHPFRADLLDARDRRKEVHLSKMCIDYT